MARLPDCPLASAAPVSPDPAARVRGPGRRPEIDRELLLQAAITLIGPDRSIATLSLREIAREAGIAPNSFYRHFPSVDALAVALIECAGESLRQIIGSARQRVGHQRSVIRGSVEAFLEQLDAEDKYLHLLLREGHVGSPAFRHAVEEQLCGFEDELVVDLKALVAAEGGHLLWPELTARALTRLVFAMGTRALDMDAVERHYLAEETIRMLRMIMLGALASHQIEDSA